MKKFFIILTFTLIFFSNSYAKDIYLSCVSTTNYKTSFIVNDEKQVLILDGVEVEVVKWTKEFIIFWKSKKLKEIGEPRDFKPDTLDRISGAYGSYSCKVVDKTLF